RSKGVFLMEAMWTRFLPHVAALRDVIERGEIGEILMLSADHGQFFDFGPEHRILDPELAGGALLDLGVYPVSFAHDLLGVPTAGSRVPSLTTCWVSRRRGTPTGSSPRRAWTARSQSPSSSRAARRRC